jgi:hypothetical protein
LAQFNKEKSMKVSKKTPKTDITVQGIALAAPMPYAEGHVLTPNEAAAVNQLLHENLRNNFANVVKKAKEAGNVDQAALQAEFDKYIEGYEFGVRRTGTGGTRIVDPVEREANKIAKTKVKEALRAKNIKLDTVAKEKFDALVAQLSSRAEIVQAAKEIVEARSKATGGKAVSLDDLGLGEAAAA